MAALQWSVERRETAKLSIFEKQFGSLFSANNGRSETFLCSALLPGIDHRPDLSRQERDLPAFAKKAGYKIVGVWKETASGAKDERAER